MHISAIVITIIMLSMPLTAFATVVDYDDEPEIQEECEERSDYDNLCSGINGATGLPFCDQYNSTERARIFPNLTNPSHCLSREYNPIEFCQEFDDLTSTYEYVETFQEVKSISNMQKQEDQMKVVSLMYIR